MGLTLDLTYNGDLELKQGDDLHQESLIGETTLAMAA